MRPLFDEHFSFRLVRRLQDVFPEARSLSNLGLERDSDLEIWHFAKREQYAIVTKDDDFEQLSYWRGAPPKVIWIQLGNASTTQMEAFLRSKLQIIANFLKNEEGAILVLKSDTQ